MTNLEIRFTTSVNNNIYFATSEKAMIAFNKKYDLPIDRSWNINVLSISQQNRIEKIGRGVYVILES